MKDIERYFSIVRKVNAGDEISDADLEFAMSYSPQVNEEKIAAYVKDTKNATEQQAREAWVEFGRKLQSTPAYKDRLLKLASETKGAEKAQRLSEGINLVLAGTDIANSINQIQASNQALKTKRPSRPVIPQRDQMLQQALRQTQDFNMGAALAPAEAQIQDQYQSDLANAKTASTGQAGAFGAYAQTGANRRNRAALNLVPMQQELIQANQNRQDNLLGMRQVETQNMFQNQAQLYNTDLYQYGLDQKNAADLGSQGRENLRNSLYNLGSQVPNAIGNNYSRKLRNRYNQASAAYGPEVAQMMAQASKNLNGYYGTMGADDTPEYWNQMY
jgi:hypothetical protein